jgi:uncharacterized repeat protein (TIGR03803 family)
MSACHTPRSAMLLGALCGLLALSMPTAGAGAAQLTTLHVFSGTPDGEMPVGGLARAKGGVLVGTTKFGGSFGGTTTSQTGTVFALLPAPHAALGWKETILLNFQGSGSESDCFAPVLAPDVVFGSQPVAPPTVDAAGNIYAAGSGACQGTLLRLAPGGPRIWTLASAETFVLPGNKPARGNTPYDAGGMALSPSGTLYGTTVGAGAHAAGEIFAATLGASPTLAVPFSFRGGDTTGANPFGGLVLGPDGSLYGTTQGNGDIRDQKIFRLASDGTYTVLHTFAAATGIDPGMLVMHGGRLYGTAANGGTLAGGGAGQGVVFSLNLARTPPAYSVLHVFGAGADGAHPSAIVFGRGGVIYGNTTNGGTDGVSGILYSLAPGAPWTETVLWAFDQTGTNGAEPSGTLVIDGAGNLYGTTQSGGGAASNGTVFRLTP